MKSLLSPNSPNLRQPLGNWNNNWMEQRTWHFMSSIDGHTIKRTVPDDSICHYSIKRKTNNERQTYLLTRISPTTQYFQHPITPKKIHADHIITYNKPQSTCKPPSITLNTQYPQNTRISDRTRRPCVLRKLLTIGIHSTIRYECQTFSWVVAQNSQQIIRQGQVQSIHPRTCSPIRSGFIGILQATKYILEILATDCTSPQNVKITICSRDRKLLRALHANQNTNQSATHMLVPEKGLLDEISPVLRRFRRFKTHRSTKHDGSPSNKNLTVTTCIKSIQQCTQAATTTYSPTGLATVFLNKSEISDDIESSIRTAVSSTDLHHYMQKKYAWCDNTISSIDWILLGKSLQLLQTNQRKTITQFTHEWLPVHGHPGRADFRLDPTCPICRRQVETQGHFLTC
jgi:hypothetical protein